MSSATNIGMQELISWLGFLLSLTTLFGSTHHSPNKKNKFQRQLQWAPTINTLFPLHT